MLEERGDVGLVAADPVEGLGEDEVELAGLRVLMATLFVGAYILLSTIAACERAMPLLISAPAPLRSTSTLSGWPVATMKNSSDTDM